MFKFYSIFKPPSKYSHIIFSLKDRILILYTNTTIRNVIILINVIIIKFNIWTKHKGKNPILQYFMAHFVS